jgi:hypothetical protein
VDDACLEKLFPIIKEKSAFKEVPRIQRFADRPSLENLLANPTGWRCVTRQIVKACLEFGYTQAHVI